MLDQLKNYSVNVQFLAEIFNVTERSIQNYVLKGMPKNERGEYPFIDCLLWLIKEQREIIADLEKENPLTVSRKKAIDLNNEKKELELQKQRGNLIEVEQATLAFSTSIKMLVRNLESVPPRLNKKINGDSKTLTIIKNEIQDIRELCASTPIPELVEDVENQLIKDYPDEM